MKPFYFFRKVHLFSALIIVVFLLMRFITGFILTSTVLPAVPAVETKEEFPLEVSDSSSDAALMAQIKTRYSLRGRLGEPEHKPDGRLVFRVDRPGHHFRVTVSSDRKTVTLRSDLRHGLRSTVELHVLHGFKGGWPYFLYGLIVDLSAAALMIFSLTGIYLGWKTVRSKTLGVVLFLLSLSYTVWVIRGFYAG